VRALALAAFLLGATAADAHDGPPFPIVSDHVTGPYSVSIWTDPDATDDGSAGGQFWVTIEASSADADIPAGTRAHVTIRPLDGAGPGLSAAAHPVRGDVTNQFAALVMDREGRFAVRAAVEGPLGAAAVDATVDATYDLRPPAFMIAWYLMPFALVAFLWARRLVRRRAAR
jgi:hypothetical protein